RRRFFPVIGIACSTDNTWSVNALGATSTNRAARELPLTRRSYQVASWVTRALAAFHFLSACWIAGMLASTMLVTSSSEMREDKAFSAAALSGALSARTIKVVSNKAKKVFVFIDPGLRLKTRCASE